LQLAAYADALSEMGVPVAREAELQLGDGTVVRYRVRDLIPVYRSQRTQLQRLLDDHYARRHPGALGRRRRKGVPSLPRVTGWRLLSGHQRGPQLGHRWVLFHGHGLAEGFSFSVIAAKSRRHSDSNSLRPNSARSPLVAPGAAGHRHPVLSRTRPASRRADLKRGKPTLGPLRLPFWLS